MIKAFSNVAAAVVIGMISGCQSTTTSPANSDLDALCDQYAAATKAGNLDQMQNLTQTINAKMANESTGNQMKWLGDCLEKHNLDGK